MACIPARAKRATPRDDDAGERRERYVERLRGERLAEVCDGGGAGEGEGCLEGCLARGEAVVDVRGVGEDLGLVFDGRRRRGHGEGR